MTDPITAEALDALLAERRKYEGWLAQLAARAATTPAHIVAKVSADYQGKLDAVLERLAGETEALGSSLAARREALATASDALRAAQDTRAELELRAAVGEFSDTEWAERREGSDRELEQLESARADIAAEVDKLVALIEDVSSGAISAPVAQAEEPEPEPAPVEEAAAEEVAEPVAPEPTAATEAREAVPPVVPVPPVAPPAPDPSDNTGPSFDELAFLKSVVGRSTPTPLGQAIVDGRPSASIEFGLPEPALDLGLALDNGAKSSAPPIEPEPESAPRESFFGRPTPRTSEAIKSLKCGECGNLNFPTEWYCEKCGGELAAM
ncbi:MAG: hypothetical protein K2X99_09015 [Gemmatimonadaceae bacterium]|nr:hypothetical protein [Gemmatimonadaceae bacterium]